MNTFDHLSDGEFEEFTYDLLVELGFKEVNWRRGTGKGGATADQGRDLVGTMYRDEVDGETYGEEWFVQCKHFKRGVPPEKLQGAVTWATAERPSCLLFVVSNFLSNPAKSYLETFERENRPAFRIKVWEGKKLEQLVSSFPKLAAKYELPTANAPQNVHPAHLGYSLKPSFNTLDFFFETIGTLEATMRDEWC